MKRMKTRAKGFVALNLAVVLVGAGAFMVPFGSANATMGPAHFYADFSCGSMMRSPPASTFYALDLMDAARYAYEGNLKTWFTEEQGLPCYQLVYTSELDKWLCLLGNAVVPLPGGADGCRYTYRFLWYRF